MITTHTTTVLLLNILDGNQFVLMFKQKIMKPTFNVYLINLSETKIIQRININHLKNRNI